MIIQANFTKDKQHISIFIRGNWFSSVTPDKFYHEYFVNFLTELNKDLDNKAIKSTHRDRAYKFIEYVSKKNDKAEFTDKLKHLLPIIYSCLPYSLYEEYKKTIIDYYSSILPILNQIN
jgi:hypothetical protein